jgi:transcriptional regulator with XRE-family HTH domain
VSQAPLMARHPAELRRWREACCGVTQRRLAEELGIGRRSLIAYERGDTPIPALLPWALAGAFKPLRSKLRQEARRARANVARRQRRQLERERRAAAAWALEQERVRKRAVRRTLTLSRACLRRGGSLAPHELEELATLRKVLDSRKLLVLPEG